MLSLNIASFGQTVTMARLRIQSWWTPWAGKTGTRTTLIRSRWDWSLTPKNVSGSFFFVYIWQQTKTQKIDWLWVLFQISYFSFVQETLRFLSNKSLTKVSAIVWCVQPNIRQDATMQRQAQFIDQFSNKTIWDNVIIICEYNTWVDSTHFINSTNNNANFSFYCVSICNQTDPCYFNTCDLSSLSRLPFPLVTFQPHWKWVNKNGQATLKTIMLRHGSWDASRKLWGPGELKDVLKMIQIKYISAFVIHIPSINSNNRGWNIRK